MASIKLHQTAELMGRPERIASGSGEPDRSSQPAVTCQSMTALVPM